MSRSNVSRFPSLTFIDQKKGHSTVPLYKDEITTFGECGLKITGTFLQQVGFLLETMNTGESQKSEEIL